MQITTSKNHVYCSRDFYWLVGGFESLIFLSSASIGGHFSQSPYSLGVENLLFTVVMLASFSALGLYNQQQQFKFSEIFLRILLGFAGGSLVLGSLFYLSSVLIAPQGLWGLLPSGLAFVSVLSLRLLVQYYRGQTKVLQNTLIFGSGQRALSILRESQRDNSPLKNEIFGFMSVAEETICIPSTQLINTNQPLADFALKHGIQQIVVALDDDTHLVPQNLLDCRNHQIKITEISDFFEKYALKIDIDSLKISHVIFDIQSKNSLQDHLCRLFDLALSGFLFLLVSPLLLITALAIFIENGFKSPIFYSQVRVGLNNVPFTIWKFRSMSVNAEKKGEVQWAQADDARVTAVGKIIRRYRIDELPQLFNIIKGDMSIVGPRPERPEFVAQLQQTIPYYLERHQVKVGLTGWAQINYPYGASDEDAKEKLKYDLYYIKHHSLWLDFVTLLQTVEVILLGKGVR